MKKILCSNCNKHKGTENWLGEGSILDYSHGNYQIWCKCCCLKSQIKYVKEASERLEKLEKKLLKVKCK